MYAPVFPVPFFALAKISLNQNIIYQDNLPPSIKYPRGDTVPHGSSPSREGNGDAGFLDWAGFLPSFLENTLQRWWSVKVKLILEGYHEQFSFQTKVFKLVALGVGHVGGLFPPIFGRQLQLAFPAVDILGCVNSV